jgi:hypothetical protein
MGVQVNIPEGKEASWTQAVSGKGWFTILRRHSRG